MYVHAIYLLFILLFVELNFFVIYELHTSHNHLAET